MQLLRLVRMLSLVSILLSACAAPPKRAAKPETCEPDFRNNAFQCTLSDGRTSVTRPFNVQIDREYILLHHKQLGNYMGTCR